MNQAVSHNIIEVNMTVTGYVEPTQDINLTVPTMEKKFDMINQQSSNDDTSNDNKNNQDENQPFIDNNDNKKFKKNIC